MEDILFVCVEGHMVYCFIDGIYVCLAPTTVNDNEPLFLIHHFPYGFPLDHVQSDLSTDPWAIYANHTRTSLINIFM